jgi:hypothetical protein
MELQRVWIVCTHLPGLFERLLEETLDEPIGDPQRKAWDDVVAVHEPEQPIPDPVRHELREMPAYEHARTVSELTRHVDSLGA